MRNKDTEYRQYILEHQKNVKKAFNEYGKLLCKELGVNLGVISLQIQSHDNSKFMNPEFDLYRRKFFKEDNEQEIQKSTCCPSVCSDDLHLYADDGVRCRRRSEDI